MIKNMKIGTKLMTGFGFVILLALVLAVVALVQLLNVQRNYDGLVDGALARRQAATEIGRDFARMRRIGTAVLLNVGDQAAIDALWQDYNYDRRLGSMTIAFQEYFYSLDNDTIQGAAALAGTRREAEELYEQINTVYHDTVVEVFRLGRLDDYYGATAAMREAAAVTEYINSLIDGLIDAAYERSDEILADTQSLVSTAIILMIVISVLVVVFAIVCALYISNIVSKPVIEVSQVIESVSQGNLEINFRDNLSRDEVGVMTKNTYDMVKTIKGMVDDIDKFVHENMVNGDIEYRIEADKYQGSYYQMLASFNTFIEDFTNGIVGMLNGLSEVNKGNFDTDIPDMPGKKMLMPNTFRATMANIRSVNDGLNAMIEAAAVKGQLSYKIDTSKYEGGWRELMVGLNNFAEAVDAPLSEIGDVMNNLSRGDFSATVSGKYAGDFLRLKESVNSTIEDLSAYITEITDTLTRVSDGDLTTSITRDYVGSFSAIKDALNNISRSLNKTMSEISSASEQVLSGAKQISSSSMDLANGASTQASSVQELNASVDLINQQTKQNADNASQANTLSQTSTDNAREGNSAMQQTLGAMNQIKESSNNISKIIRTIQDIAFQTNLLALNAAVEAARAGEHGKGFAVVAEEVRSLAARSQEAASETTELIGTSISTVDSGSEIAQSTAETLNTIVDNANKVLDIVSNISTSSQEQAEAISQVVTGLQQISQVVQSNSAVSEEAAAASEELTSQAEILQQLVGFFKL